MSKITQMAIKWAENQMRQVREVGNEQYKWRIKHPEEPCVAGGIKACFLFQRDAFLYGEKAALMMILEKIEQMSKEDGNTQAQEIRRFIEYQLSLKF